MRAVILALACTGAEAPAETPAVVVEARDTGSPIDWSATEVPPEYELADLDAIVTSIMTEGLESPPDFVTWWEAMYDDLASETPGCPIPRDRLTEVDGTTVADWYGPCDGVRYSLYGFWNALLYTNQIAGFDAEVVELAFSLDGTVDGDGVVHAGGRVKVESAPTPSGGRNFNVEIAGAFLDEGQEGALGEGVGLALEWSGVWSEELGFFGTIEGPVSGPAGAIYLDGVSMDLNNGPGPLGTIGIRDPSSGWWQVALADDSSGCGTASWAGTEIGDSCVGLALAEALDGHLASWESE